MSKTLQQLINESPLQPNEKEELASALLEHLSEEEQAGIAELAENYVEEDPSVSPKKTRCWVRVTTSLLGLCLWK